MKYLLMTRTERDELWSALETMPAFLLEQFGSLPAQQTTLPGPDGAFSPVEHRAGTQEGVGRVALCDLPHMMAEHDAAHRAEIAAWSRRT